MGEMRLLLGDRWSGGLLAAIASLCLLVQIFLSASACAAALAVAPDPLGVLCHGAPAGDSPVSQAPERTHPDCRCPSGILCGAGVAFTAPDVPASTGSYARGNAVAIRFAAIDPARPASPPDTGKPFSTGPPPLSA